MGNESPMGMSKERSNQENQIIGRERMGFITPEMAEDTQSYEEEVNWGNMEKLLKDLNRPKQLGNLGILSWAGQGKIMIGRYAKPLTEVVLCTITDEEQAEAQKIMKEMEVSFIHNGLVFYKRDDCPQHFRPYGTGDCTCEPR